MESPTQIGYDNPNLYEGINKRIEKILHPPAQETKLQEYDRNEWRTPPDIIARVKATFISGKIDLDPASNSAANQIVGAEHYYTKEQNGLTKSWDLISCNGGGEYVRTLFLNPPYSAALVQTFVKKFIAWTQPNDGFYSPQKEAILLVNNCTDTRWFHACANEPFEFCLTKRIKFYHPDRPEAVQPRQGQAIFYHGDFPKRFHDAFNSLGPIVLRV